MSLAGRTVLITRPSGQADALAALLEAEGARAERFALLEILPQPDELALLAQQGAEADWLIFVSPSAIDCAWPSLGALPASVRLACVGAASAAKLERLSGRAVLCPREGSDSTALLAESALQAVRGQRIVIVRGKGGRAQLGETLSQRGAALSHAEVYQRIDSEPDWPRFDQLLQQRQLDACIVTSGEIAERLFRLAGSARIPALQCLQYCVPHPRIAEKLTALGVARIVTTRADDAALVAGLREWFSRHP
jgi:uroporphyrinogen-III synthase